MTNTSTFQNSSSNIFTYLKFTTVFLILCGVIYPVVTTLIASLLFPHQANGSLLKLNGTLVGSSLVGQPFSNQTYFIGRPSAAGDGYNPTSVSGSNWSVSNPSLRERSSTTSAEIVARERVNSEQIPVDLIAASGSGIDPHISPEAATLQVARVAEAQGLSKEQVQNLVKKYMSRNVLGLGMPGINVLELNLALDNLSQ